MKRRELITRFGGALSWPLTASAQEPGRVYRLGTAMWRRDVIALLGGATASWPLTAGAQQPVYRYQLQSSNLDDLRRYAPMIEAQMRRLPVLENVSVDTQLNDDQAIVDVDHKKTGVPGVKELPTVTVSFRLAPKAALADAIAQIHDMEIRLALPPTITASLAKAE